MDTILAIVWTVFLVWIVSSSVYIWVLLARTQPGQDGIHVYLASILTSRVIFCLIVTLMIVVVILSHGQINWTIVSCHALYWSWTVTWVSDMLTTMAATVWGMAKVGAISRSFRVASMVTVTIVWLIAAAAAAILTFFNQRIKHISADTHFECKLLPGTNQVAITAGLLSLQATACILMTLFLTFISIQLIQVNRRHRRASISQPEGPHGRTTKLNGHVTVHVIKEPSRLDAIEDPPAQPRLTPGELSLVRDWRKLLFAAILPTIFLSLLPQILLAGLGLMRATDIAHAQTALISCGLLHGTLLPVFLLVASEAYRATSRALLARQNPEIQTGLDTPTNGARIGRAGNRSGRENEAFDESMVKRSTASFQVTPEVRPQNLSVNRSDSRISRAEWKEKMMRENLPPTIHKCVNTTNVSSRSRIINPASPPERSSGSRKSPCIETDSEDQSTVYDVADIDDVLETHIPATNVMPHCSHTTGSPEQGVANRNRVKYTNHPVSNSPSLGTQMWRSTEDIYSEVRPDEKNPGPPTRHSRDHGHRTSRPRNYRHGLYGTLSQALGYQQEEEYHQRTAGSQYMTPAAGSMATPGMVGSPRNPFRNPDEDTESESSIEAEIVAITIRGRGSLRHRLEQYRTRHGGTYATKVSHHAHAREVDREMGVMPYKQQGLGVGAMYSNTSLPYEQQGRGGARYSNRNPPYDQQGSVVAGYSNTNPFLLDTKQDSIPGPNADIHRTDQEYPMGHNPAELCPERPKSTNPFLNSEEALFSQAAYGTRSSSNPFLWDAEGEQQPRGQPELAGEFFTRSEPASPSEVRTFAKRTGRSAQFALSLLALLHPKGANKGVVDDDRAGPTVGPYPNPPGSRPRPRATSYTTAYV